MPSQIVIIEDNQELVTFIKEYLEANGDFQVKGYHTGSEGMSAVVEAPPVLVIIDLELDDLRGDTICVELRKSYPDLPIIILTGDKSPESIIHCLNSGADDYITKPFNAAELLARINARLRSVDNMINAKILTSGDLIVDTETLEVKKDGEKVELSAKEFELLKYLLANKSRILTREKILNAVWGYTSMVDTRVVDVHIGKLRKKLETDPGKPILETVRGFGYRINE